MPFNDDNGDDRPLTPMEITLLVLAATLFVTALLGGLMLVVRLVLGG